MHYNFGLIQFSLTPALSHSLALSRPRPRPRPHPRALSLFGPQLYDIAKALDPTRFVIDCDGVAGPVARREAEFFSIQFDVMNLGSWGNIPLDHGTKYWDVCDKTTNVCRFTAQPARPAKQFIGFHRESAREYCWGAPTAPLSVRSGAAAACCLLSVLTRAC